MHANLAAVRRAGYVRPSAAAGSPPLQCGHVAAHRWAEESAVERDCAMEGETMAAKADTEKTREMRKSQFRSFSFASSLSLSFPLRSPLLPQSPENATTTTHTLCVGSSDGKTRSLDDDRKPSPVALIFPSSFFSLSLSTHFIFQLSFSYAVHCTMWLQCLSLPLLLSLSTTAALSIPASRRLLLFTLTHYVTSHTQTLTHSPLPLPLSSPNTTTAARL